MEMGTVAGGDGRRRLRTRRGHQGSGLLLGPIDDSSYDLSMRWLLLLIPVLLAVAFFGLHRLALWAEGRGWIYYKTKRAPAGAGSLAMLEVAQIFEPEVEHVVEAEQADRLRADHRESGEGGSGAMTTPGRTG